VLDATGKEMSPTDPVVLVKTQEVNDPTAQAAEVSRSVAEGKLAGSAHSTTTDDILSTSEGSVKDAHGEDLSETETIVAVPVSDLPSPAPGMYYWHCDALDDFDFSRDISNEAGMNREEFEKRIAQEPCDEETPCDCYSREDKSKSAGAGSADPQDSTNDDARSAAPVGAVPPSGVNFVKQCEACLDPNSGNY
jgi:hypothetical protein